MRVMILFLLMVELCCFSCSDYESGSLLKSSNPLKSQADKPQYGFVMSVVKVPRNIVFYPDSTLPEGSVFCHATLISEYSFITSSECTSNSSDWITYLVDLKYHSIPELIKISTPIKTYKLGSLAILTFDTNISKFLNIKPISIYQPKAQQDIFQASMIRFPKDLFQINWKIQLDSSYKIMPDESGIKLISSNKVKKSYVKLSSCESIYQYKIRSAGIYLYDRGVPFFIEDEGSLKLLGIASISKVPGSASGWVISPYAGSFLKQALGKK